MPSDSWILVTGANRGLGYVTAKKLVTDGESVIIGARSQASGGQCYHASLMSVSHTLHLRPAVQEHAAALRVAPVPSTTLQLSPGLLGMLAHLC